MTSSPTGAADCRMTSLGDVTAGGATAAAAAELRRASGATLLLVVVSHAVLAVLSVTGNAPTDPRDALPRGRSV